MNKNNSIKNEEINIKTLIKKTPSLTQNKNCINFKYDDYILNKNNCQTLKNGYFTEKYEHVKHKILKLK